MWVFPTKLEDSKDVYRKTDIATKENESNKNAHENADDTQAGMRMTTVILVAMMLSK